MLGLLTGCIQPASQECGASGATYRCPSSLTCDLAHQECVTEEQLERCIGMTDGISDPGRNLADPADDNANGKRCIDLGFYQDTAPRCAADCTFDRTSCAEECGDGIVQVRAGEICEREIAPTRTCVDYGFGAGVLGCSNCGPATDACVPFGWRLANLPGPDGVWFVDENTYGAALHYHGGQLTSLQHLIGDGGQTLAVWAASASDVFILYFHDGQRSPVDLGTFVGVAQVDGVGDSVMLLDSTGNWNQLLRLVPWN